MVSGIMGIKPMLSLPDNVKEHLLNSVEFPKRFEKPAEKGRFALFMVQSEYLNGECIRLDGGLRASARQVITQSNRSYNVRCNCP